MTEAQKIAELEKALAEEKAKLLAETVRAAAVVNSIGEGLIITNAHGTITEANPVSQKLLGTSKDKLVGQWYPQAVQLTDVNEKVLDQQDRPEIQAIMSGDVTETKQYCLKVGDRQIPVSITASPYIMDGRPVGTVIALKDITDERELEQAKDDFLGLASHQLRTPATAVKQYVGLLLDGYTGELTKEQLETLQAAQDSNERQINVIQDMLNVVRLESGKLDVNATALDLKDTVAASLEEQKNIISQRQQQVTQNLESCPMQGDEKLLRMVVENLISNASKYTPEKGKIDISLTQKDGVVMFSVADSGVGISKEDQEDLFKRFSRIKNKLSDVVGGSGLGLYIAKKIVDLHGGKISVSSVPEKGTTFTMSLNKDLQKK